MRLLFRVDGNSAIGMGHIVRCISIARAARAQGAICHFVLAEEYMAPILRQHGFDFTVLKTDHKNMEEEKNIFSPIVLDFAPNNIVADSYFVTDNYLKWLCKFSSVTYIDDVAAFAYPVNRVVNYNLYGPKLNYERLYREAGTVAPNLVLGPTYAPLREDFQNLPPRESRLDVRHVLLSTGGSDPENIAQKLLSLVQKTPDWEHIQFHIVIGSMNPNKSELVHMAQMIPNVQIHVAIRDMAHLMQMCDMAVAAAGSTLYELCACGTPTVTYILADNQIPGAQEFERQGLMLNAGDCRQSDFMLHLFEKMMTLLTSVKMRRMMSAQMQRTVDGFGAKRLAQELLKNISKP